MTEPRDALFVARNTDGRLVQRPLSPHIGIYRWPVTMAASILNRATGIALSVGTLLLVWWLAAAAAGPASFARVQEFLISPLGLLLLLGWTLSLFFHLFSGIRHLAWDMGLGFEHRKLNPVTWGIFAATIVATVIVWAVAYARLGG